LKEYNKKKLTKAGWLLFYLYIILLSYFLFFSEHYGRDYILEEYRYNLEFLKEIKRFIRYRELLGLESFVVNILGNVLAFAPFGFMLPLLNKKYRKFFILFFLSILFSLTVEVAQMLLKVGIFDVDDILLNTIGGIIGYLFFAICNGIYRGLHHKKQKTKINKKRGRRE
jgi:glycopeptide antibiotics resistance protein